MYKNLTLKYVALIFSATFLLNACSAFQVKQINENGSNRTYITDTIFVGTGTFLDCLISPVHMVAGVFYAQPYIRVKGGNMAYPRFGGSGCLNSGYSQGRGITSLFGLIDFPLLREDPGHNTQVYFIDPDGKERMISGDSFEITRIAPNINFHMSWPWSK